MDEFNQNVAREFRANQVKISGAMEGMLILLLTMIGGKTGRSLIRLLCFSCDGDRLVIIASYGGAPHNPPWHHNLVANRLVKVDARADRISRTSIRKWMALVFQLPVGIAQKSTVG